MFVFLLFHVATATLLTDELNNPDIVSPSQYTVVQVAQACIPTLSDNALFAALPLELDLCSYNPDDADDSDRNTTLHFEDANLTIRERCNALSSLVLATASCDSTLPKPIGEALAITSYAFHSTTCNGPRIADATSIAILLASILQILDPNPVLANVPLFTNRTNFTQAAQTLIDITTNDPAAAHIPSLTFFTGRQFVASIPNRNITLPFIVLRLSQACDRTMYASFGTLADIRNTFKDAFAYSNLDDRTFAEGLSDACSNILSVVILALQAFAVQGDLAESLLPGSVISIADSLPVTSNYYERFTCDDVDHSIWHARATELIVQLWDLATLLHSLQPCDPDFDNNYDWVWPTLWVMAALCALITLAAAIARCACLPSSHGPWIAFVAVQTAVAFYTAIETDANNGSVCTFQANDVITVFCAFFLALATVARFIFARLRSLKASATIATIVSVPTLYVAFRVGGNVGAAQASVALLQWAVLSIYYQKQL
jgi:hypothetical protein